MDSYARSPGDPSSLQVVRSAAGTALPTRRNNAQEGCRRCGCHRWSGSRGCRHGRRRRWCQGAAIGSPGVLSGNVVQVPVHIPVNVCGNTINVIGLLNPPSATPASTPDASEVFGPGAHSSAPGPPGFQAWNHIFRHTRRGSLDGRAVERRPNVHTRGRVQMRRPAQVTRKTLITMAAAGGVLALGGGYAHADSGAKGHAANSPGLLSGNTVQAPVDAPVNVCGNSVTVVGASTPSSGTTAPTSRTSRSRTRRPTRATTNRATTTLGTPVTRQPR